MRENFVGWKRLTPARWNAPRLCSPILGAIDAATGIDHDARPAHVGIPGTPALRAHAPRGQDYGCVRPVALIAALTQGRDLLIGSPARSQSDDARDDLFGSRTESDFFVLMRAWRYAERNGYHVDRCRRAGIHAQAARQVGPLFEQFLRIAAVKGWTCVRSRSITLRCSAVFSWVFPTSSPSAWTTIPCAASWSTAGAEVGARERGRSALLVVSEAREVARGRSRDRVLNVALNLATAVKEEWLRELFPRDFTRKLCR